MAKKKISNLDPAQALTGSEVLPIVQDGTTRKATPFQISDLITESALTEVGTLVTEANTAADTATTKATEAAASAAEAADSAAASMADTAAIRSDLAASTGSGLVGYLTGTVASFLNSLGSATATAGSYLIGYLAAATGVARTVMARLRDDVNVCDFGADATGTNDCSPASALAVQHAIDTGRGVFYPAGTFKHLSPTTMSTMVPVRGAGVGRTKITAPYNGPLFECTNTVTGSHLSFGDFSFTGGGGAGAAPNSCVFHFAPSSKTTTFTKYGDITAQGCYAFLISDADEEYVASSGLYRGVMSWNTFENINLRNGVKYGVLFNKGSGTGNVWIGGKPAIGVAGGAVMEVNGAKAASNAMQGINCGDLLFLNVHALAEGAAAGNCAFFRGGADTTYRSRIGFYGCQFDASQDIPMDLSSTGSVAWSNIRLPHDNNIGGAVNFYDHVPALARSIVDDQGVSCHRAQFNRSVAPGSGAISDDIFAVALGTTSGAEVKIVSTGTQGSEGSYVRVYRWLLRRGVGAASILEVESLRDGSTIPGFTITPTSDANGVVTFTWTYTAPASGSDSSFDFQLIAVGGTLKVQNGRYL